eukprot:TRINITY_DN13581_c0_g1_i2.p1 TRINITY_DN13581_c0_g1~~TRINITY_DN13581_c0_g1_i2.p1  ORF type:complete len:731 (-),score=121.07 TRINITY_DN13581_c0_g1_i2:78-2240(-)
MAQQENLKTQDYEEVLYSQRTRFHRFCNQKWKDEGNGQALLLRDTKRRTVRFTWQEEKTHAAVADHLIREGRKHCILKPNAGSDHCWTWSAVEQKPASIQAEEAWFALGFPNPALAAGFKEAFDQAKELNCQAENFPHDQELFCQLAKLYLWSNGKWQMFGLGRGKARLLSHCHTGRVRFVFERKGKFGRAALTHHVVDHQDYCNLKTNAGSPCCWTWAARNCTGDRPREERLALKFVTAPMADTFSEVFEHARDFVLSVAENFALEEELSAFRSRLYIFVEGAWQEKGSGDAKLLKHRRTGRVRFIWRDKSAAICANHHVSTEGQQCQLKPNRATSDCWVWSARDHSGDTIRTERFALKLEDAQTAAEFQRLFEQAASADPGGPRVASCSVAGAGASQPGLQPPAQPAALAAGAGARGVPAAQSRSAAVPGKLPASPASPVSSCSSPTIFEGEIGTGRPFSQSDDTAARVADFIARSQPVSRLEATVARTRTPPPPPPPPMARQPPPKPLQSRHRQQHALAAAQAVEERHGQRTGQVTAAKAAAWAAAKAEVQAGSKSSVPSLPLPQETAPVRPNELRAEVLQAMQTASSRNSKRSGRDVRSCSRSRSRRRGRQRRTRSRSRGGKNLVLKPNTGNRQTASAGSRGFAVKSGFPPPPPPSFDLQQTHGARPKSQGLAAQVRLTECAYGYGYGYGYGASGGQSSSPAGGGYGYGSGSGRWR